MNPKLKTCKTCGEQKYLWSKGNCKDCDGKERAKNIIYKPAKAITYKRKPTGEAEVFKEVYIRQKGFCFITGKYIIEPIPSCFPHVLSKSNGKYPLFKLNPKNIILTLPEIHHLIDFGTQQQREKFGYPEGWAKLQDLREELLEDYRELLRQNKIIENK